METPPKLNRLLLLLIHQVGFYESIQFAVHDRAYIAYFVVGAVVFYHFVRVKYIAAYLAAPFYLFLFAVGGIS